MSYRKYRYDIIIITTAAALACALVALLFALYLFERRAEAQSTLKACLSTGELQYIRDWRGECKRLNLPSRCTLSAHDVRVLEMAKARLMRDACVRRYQ